MIDRLRRRAAALFGLPVDAITVTEERSPQILTIHVPEGARPVLHQDDLRVAALYGCDAAVVAAHRAWGRAQTALGNEVLPDIVVRIDDGFLARLDAEVEAEARRVAARLPAWAHDLYLDGHRHGWAVKKALQVAVERELRVRERDGGWTALDYARRERRGLELQIAWYDALTTDLERLLPPEPLRFFVHIPPGPPCSSPT